jgi:hypothetical protein
MNEIELEAAPVLIPLILGNKSRLTPKDQLIVAKWAILKAIVAEYDDDTGVKTHHAQLKYFFNRKLPPERGWAVWIGSFERKNLLMQWFTRPFLLVPQATRERLKTPRASYSNSHVTTQIIGKLFIHTLHTPHPGFPEKWRFFTPNRGMLLRIWGPRQFGIKWPAGRAMDDDDAYYVANAVTEFILDIQRGEGLV